MSYIELHTASAFSFLQGASLPESIVERAVDLGYPAVALLDRNGVYGAPRFHKAATAAGLRAIVGAELTITAGGVLLPVLCETQEGYQNLCRLITRMNMRAPKGEGALTLDDLDGSTGGLVALAGRAALWAPSALGASHHVRRDGASGLMDRLVGLFGRGGVYVELQRHFRRDEEADNQALVHLASAFHVPIIATNGVRFATTSERPLFDVVTCIHHHTTLAEAGRRLAPNAERYLKPPADMAALFSDRPEAIARTRELADRLQYTMADLGYRFPDYPVPPGETQATFLRQMVEIGARERYRPYHDRVRAQMARELDLIEKLNLAGYFLIVWDIVNFCRQHDVLVQGRGSAANSAVCYSLGITAVDPVAMDLLFERFLSKERSEWPDIDLDLPSGDRRELVIQHVYETYNSRGAAPEGPRVGMTANVITYRGRSAARDVGKVLGFGADQVDRLAKVMNHFEFTDPAEARPRQLMSIGLDLSSDRVRLFSRLWGDIQDLPRHLGQHSGGMVICQGQLDAVVPLEHASMPGRVVVQWDKDDCADMGLIKVDLLGLGMMAVIQDSLALVNREVSIKRPVVDLAHLPQDDARVYRMLCEADTIGVFQVESRAQMATLPRLKPACFYDIVVQVAIIRPGPIVGKMVHPYLNRRAGREPVVYPHPLLEPTLARTLGVPLFQEQLLRMAMVAAGFTGGQAEELRRTFGFKRSERRMKPIEVQLRDGMARQGITGAAAEQIITSVTSFAQYGFPESHAASFALLAYASAYLKVHYPAAFYTALLNNQPMGFYHPSTLVKDAQRRGVRFHPIDVHLSDWDCTVEVDGAIRLGLRYVSGLRQQAGKAIATAARRRFVSLDDLIARTGVRRDEVVTLADIGALNAFGYDRRSALWQAERAVRPSGELFDETGQAGRAGWAGDAEEIESACGHAERGPGQSERSISVSSRWGRAPTRGSRAWGPSASEKKDDDCPLKPMTEAERIVADYAGTGLTVGRHPMALRREELAMRGVLRASDLRAARQGRRVRVAGMVITRQRPGTARGFVFLTLEDETGVANIIVRPDLFARDRLTIVEEPFLIVDGVLQNQDGVTSVRAEQLLGLRGIGDLECDARDFY